MQTVTATSLAADIPRSPSPRPQEQSEWLEPPPRPQAWHRYLDREDVRWGCDLHPPSPPRGSRQPYYRLAQAPRLTTIAEDWRLRCRRVEIDDERGEGVRFSGVYCPPVFGPGATPMEVRLVHCECLENFAVLRPRGVGYANITQTMNDQRRRALYQYALELYREAFAYGLLR